MDATVGSGADRVNRAAASPPTDRVLDVVELLARRGDEPLTLADLVRELGLTRATAHAILGTLTDRGWARRNPVDKTFTLGPALGLAVRGFEAGRPLAHRAREAATALAAELGMPAAIAQVVGGELVITDFVSPAGEAWEVSVGERLPFAAPFGAAFVAWLPEPGRRAWVERSGIADPELAARLERVLEVVRERGYSVEHMSRSTAQAVRLLGALQDDTLSQVMRQLVEQLLTEITAAASLGEPPTGVEHPVSGIVAPVFDATGEVVLNLGLHPLRRLPRRRIERVGQALLAATAELSASLPSPRTG